MIEATGIRVRAGGRTLLDGVSASVRPGRVLAVLGPNGAGKSTLLDVLAGGRPPEAGRVVMDGRPMASWPAAALARSRAVLGQSTTVGFAFTVAEVVALGRQPFAGTAAMRDDAAAVAAARDALALGALWRRRFPGLSGGEQQRAHMARVLAQLWRAPGDAAARTLLLDEPTSALDLRHRRAVLGHARRLADEGAAVGIVLHDLNLAAAYADDVLLLRDGRVLADGPVRAVLTEAALEACFEVPVEALMRADGSTAFVT